MTEKVTQAIDELMEQEPQAIVAVGLREDGTAVIRTSESNVAVIHWLLNKAIFELNVFENNQKTVSQEEAA